MPPLQLIQRYDAELAHTYFYLNGKFTGPALKDAGPMKLSTWWVSTRCLLTGLTPLVLSEGVNH